MAQQDPLPMPPAPAGGDRIPAPTDEAEGVRPGNGRFGFVPQDFPAHTDRKGNRGMDGLPPRDVSAENPDPAYVPFVITRKGR